MDNSIFRFCKKCQCETERSARGECRPCKKACAADWYAANNEKHKAASAAQYAANTERHKVTDAARYAANPERKKATNAVWVKANPEARRIYEQNRRARQRENGGTLSKGLTDKLFNLQRGLCPCCNRPLGANFHLDHIMPITLGGPNIDSNMQLLLQRCNNQKKAAHPVNFMQSRGFLL